MWHNDQWEKENFKFRKTVGEKLYVCIQDNKELLDKSQIIYTKKKNIDIFNHIEFKFCPKRTHKKWKHKHKHTKMETQNEKLFSMNKIYQGLVSRIHIEYLLINKTKIT